MCPLTSRNRGASLVEVLVVITIIGIVSAIAFSALNTAKRTAQSSSHMSALRQLSMAVVLYGEDHAVEGSRLKFLASAETLSKNAALSKSGIFAFVGDKYSQGWGNFTRGSVTFTGEVPYIYSPLGFGDFVTEAFVLSSPKRYGGCLEHPFALFAYPAAEVKKFGEMYDVSKPASSRPILRASADGSVSRNYVQKTTEPGAHPFEVFGDLNGECAKVRDIGPI